MPRIFHCTIHSIEYNEIDYYLGFLPSPIQSEITRYKFTKDRKSRLLARLMLLNELRASSQESLIHNWKRDENNKPFIEEWNEFSISHSGDMVLFCSFENKIGIDIEQISNINYLELSNYFCDEEKEYILESEDKSLNRFYEIWVKKEALLKAIGTGIVNGLKQFNCIEDKVKFNGQIWFLTKLKLQEGYMAYLCSNEEKPLLKVKNFQPNELQNFNVELE